MGLILAYILGVITPFAKDRFIQIVKHFNEYLKKKIDNM